MGFIGGAVLPAVASTTEEPEVARRQWSITFVAEVSSKAVTGEVPGKVEPDVKVDESTLFPENSENEVGVFSPLTLNDNALIASPRLIVSVLGSALVTVTSRPPLTALKSRVAASGPDPPLPVPVAEKTTSAFAALDTGPHQQSAARNIARGEIFDELMAPAVQVEKEPAA